MKPLAPLLILALSACITINYGERAPGWPADMRVTEHYVSHKQMRDKCAQYVGFLESPEACAEYDTAAKRCDIYYSADFPPADWVKAHERAHCAGYLKHEGES